MEWREWLLFLPKTPLFLFNHCLGCPLRHNHNFPSFSGDSMDGKANTSVMSVVLGRTWCLVFEWCWWTTMNHITTTTPTMCAFLLFTSCVFHSHPHQTNGVHVIVSPMVCSVTQPMACAIHSSFQHNHILTLASLTTDTHHVGSVITVNTKQPDTVMVKAIQQMHELKGQGQRHTVCWVWLDCMITSWKTMGY